MFTNLAILGASHCRNLCYNPLEYGGSLFLHRPLVFDYAFYGALTVQRRDGTNDGNWIGVTIAYFDNVHVRLGKYH